jgi:hypothetical protein
MNLKRKTPMLVAALLATLVAASGGTALAGTSHPSAATTAHDRVDSREHRLNGTWSTQVTLTDAPPGAPATFSALDTFLPGGGLLVSSSAPNPATRGLAHGLWTHRHDRAFTTTFVWYRFDPTGACVGTQKVTRTLKLSRDGKRFHSQDVIEIVAPDGAVLATYHATEVGTLLTDG